MTQRVLFVCRSGRRATNWALYQRALEEFGRIVVPGTGRAVLLTHDTRALTAVSTTPAKLGHYSLSLSPLTSSSTIPTD